MQEIWDGMAGPYRPAVTVSGQRGRFRAAARPYEAGAQRTASPAPWSMDMHNGPVGMRQAAPGRPMYEISWDRAANQLAAAGAQRLKNIALETF